MWENISMWFSDLRERRELLRSFNYAAKQAYMFEEVPILLQASITLGRSEYRTNYSWIRSGFRIKTLTSGYFMQNHEAGVIAMIILSNTTLVRQLITLGFDTLEVGTESGNSIYLWPLIRFSIPEKL